MFSLGNFPDPFLPTKTVPVNNKQKHNTLWQQWYKHVTLARGTYISCPQTCLSLLNLTRKMYQQIVIVYLRVYYMSYNTCMTFHQTTAVRETLLLGTSRQLLSYSVNNNKSISSYNVSCYKIHQILPAIIMHWALQTKCKRCLNRTRRQLK